MQDSDDRPETDIDDAWAGEIESRCAGVDAGALTASDWDDVRQRIEREIFGR